MSVIETQQAVDPAVVAKAKLEAKRKNYTRIKRKFYAIIGAIAFSILLLLTAIGIGGYYAITKYGVGDMTRNLDTVYKECTFEMKGHTIVGKRKFVMHYTELFGFRFLDNTRTTETTHFSVRGEPLRVIALEGMDIKYVISIGTGERYEQNLNPAQAYLFIFAKDHGLVTHEEFCK